MVATCVGAIDQGTSSTRFIIFDGSTRIVAEAQVEHEQIYPHPGWVEHDAIEIWRNTQTVIAAALRSAGLAPRDLAAIGITNQRETTVVWDRHTGVPLTNAIVWQDVRVADDVGRLSAAPGVEFFRARTGLPLSSYFSSLKIRWVLEHIPGARERAERGDALFGTIDSFLVWQLTGGADGGLHVTDVTNASRTQLMNLETLQWDSELLAAFDIPRAMLPAIRSSSERYGPVGVEPLAGVPIAGILGDQQAALVGQTCFRPGEAKNTYGTGCFLLLNTGESAVRSTSGLLTTVAYQMGSAAPRYALEGSVAITGALVQWIRDNLGLIQQSADIEALARSVADNGGVYFVPAFSGLYAPHWNDGARGTIVGLTRFVNRNDPLLGSPWGTGLPPGSGTPAQGAGVYAERGCALCHGEKGGGGPSGRNGDALPAALPVTVRRIASLYRETFRVPRGETRRDRATGTASCASNRSRD